MFSNSLTREVGLKVGPTVLEVLVKHYFDRVKDDTQDGEARGSLKQDDVLYHEAFAIIKSFLSASTLHTVEELQSFSNTRTPSPPWTHVVRVVVPIASCDVAAPYLIQALGGEDMAKRLVGGTKWWQVRGINGVDGQWITAKKDYQEAKKRYKQQSETRASTEPIPPVVEPPGSSDSANSAAYEKNMDAMRCILYLHGGGYYFGSVDQERYSIQRLARKINGRVFAINYRLAPQYPFPCALHDALAAYLFLIRPPAGSVHRAVNPKHIIISGDSAGGGLSLALLQVIRDCGLPAPAGGVLISPWCDLTHSFPSVHLNTATDIIPESGLSFHKPSSLWPPPSEEISDRVNASIRFRLRQALGSDDTPAFNPVSTIDSQNQDQDLASPSTPLLDRGVCADPEKVTVFDSMSGETIEVNEQLHFYATNSLLAHPLVSPALSYLGGLPPLLFIAGDKEVLRDEVIYTAHKAAYPEKYPVEDRIRKLYPVLDGIESRSEPTPVHLQVYEDSPHILPILFSFSTPAKFCFRAMASFTKFVTKMPLANPNNLARKGSSSSPQKKLTRRQSLFAGFKQSMGTKQNSSMLPQAPLNTRIGSHSTVTSPTSPTFAAELMHSPPAISLTASPTSSEQQLDKLDSPPPIRRSISASLTRPSSRFMFRRSPSTISRSENIREALQEDEQTNVTGAGQAGKVHSELTSEAGGPASPPLPPTAANGTPKPSVASSDVGGPRFMIDPLVDEPKPTERYAGEVEVYDNIPDPMHWPTRMIRERVSTTGTVAQLEPEAELDAFQVPAESVGRFNAQTMHRYRRDRARFEKKFAHTAEKIEKQRRRNLQRAKQDTIKRMGVLKQVLRRDSRLVGGSASHSTVGMRGGSVSGTVGPEAGVVTEPARAKETPTWAWAWALDADEAPPPSSIVARRDTEEARKLAEVADQAIMGPDHVLSGNNLWAVVNNFLTITPGKETHWLGARRRKDGNGKKEPETEPQNENEKEKEKEAEREERASGTGTEGSVSETQSEGAAPRRRGTRLAGLRFWDTSKWKSHSQNTKDVHS